MNDCQNAEIRDQLPDLLHERLDAATRTALVAHVGACADCRDELELLRVARGTLVRATPRVDLNLIIEALPNAAPRTLTPKIARRAMWADWRVAAAAVLMVVGASSYSLLGRHGGVAVRDSLGAQVPPLASDIRSVQPHSGDSTAIVRAPAPRPETLLAESSPGAGETSGLGTSRLGDLDEKQLKALLTEIDQLQPTPITEPDPVTIRVDTKGTATPEGL